MKINLLKHLEELIGDEAVEGFTFNADRHENPVCPLLDWYQHRQYFDLECGNEDWENGKMPAFFIWTESRVIFVMSYDTAPCIRSVPRRPEACRTYKISFGD